MRALTTLVLWARCWGARPLLLLGAATAAGWYVVPRGPIPVPAGGGVESLLWPLLPVLVALGVPGVLGSAYGDLERASSRRPVLLRLAALAGCALVVAAAAALDTRFDDRVVWRNAALLLGLAAMTTRLLPRALRWQPLLLVPMAMWLLGTDEQRRIRPWAVLLLPGDTMPSTVVAAAVFAAGIATYLLLPARVG
jgi:hypothetical protein